MALSFPRTARLRRASEFARLRKEGRTVHGKLMVLSVLRHERDSGDARIGIVTSRRVGGAVVRNRVRRRLREAVRLSRGSLLADCWLVLIARRLAADATYQALEAEWQTLARRSGVLPPPS